MYPYWNIGNFSISMRSFMINIGSIVGIVVVFCILYRTFICGNRNKKTIVKYLLTPCIATAIALVVIGGSVGHLSRVLLWDEHSEGIHYLSYVKNSGGTHFIGQILVTSVLLPLIFRWVYGRKEMDQVLSCVAFFIPIQHIFSRIGCFLGGCCYGIPTNGVLGVQFPKSVEEYPVFPSQLFEILLMIGIIVVQIRRWKKGKPLFAITVLYFSIAIFVSELWMHKDGVMYYAGLTSIQYFAIITGGVSVLLMIGEYRRRKLQ